MIAWRVCLRTDELEVAADPVMVHVVRKDPYSPEASS